MSWNHQAINCEPSLLPCPRRLDWWVKCPRPCRFPIEENADGSDMHAHSKIRSPTPRTCRLCVQLQLGRMPSIHRESGFESRIPRIKERRAKTVDSQRTPLESFFFGWLSLLVVSSLPPPLPPTCPMGLLSSSSPDRVGPTQTCSSSTVHWSRVLNTTDSQARFPLILISAHRMCSLPPSKSTGLQPFLCAGLACATYIQ